MNIKQIKAIEAADKKRILKVCPDCPETSGIYFLLREEEGFKYAYIGQAKHLLTRLAQHLRGYQHIDLSLKKHGLYSEDNKTGYRVHFLLFPESELDEMEQRYIKQYANAGYQLRNQTSGSQGKGKKSISDTGKKGYMQGVAQGYMNARKDIAHLFKLHLEVDTKKHPPTKLQERALQKFFEFIEVEEQDEDE